MEHLTREAAECVSPLAAAVTLLVVLTFGLDWAFRLF